MQPSAIEVLYQTQRDLKIDYDLLLYLTQDYLEKLSALKAGIKRQAKVLPVVSPVYTHTDRFVTLLSEKSQQLKLNLKLISSDNFSLDSSVRYIEFKYQTYNLLRSISEIIGALCTSLYWLSPSYMSSQESQAGMENGKIKVGVNDYKRDYHYPAISYERKFIQQYIDSPFKAAIMAYAVNSGMAAFTTILNMIRASDTLSGGRIIAGKSTYFEALNLLQTVFGSRLVLVDESNPTQVVKTIKQVKPKILFFDTLGNTPQMPFSPISLIIKAVNMNCPKNSYLVIDNTGMSIHFQPFAKSLNILPKNNILIYESLNKFHQFGLDRVLGGIIYGTGPQVNRIFDTRKTTGTNITPVSAFTLPTPNRKKLEQKLERHSRNTQILVQELHQHLSTHTHNLINRIIHPDLDTHTTHGIKKEFRGGFFMLQAVQNNKKLAKNYIRFTDKTLQIARKSHVTLLAGTSFGLPITRIYPTALAAGNTLPFLRISPGMETITEIYNLVKCLKTALS